MSEGFPSLGFSGEEFGVNGPACDAVAKKPWLGSVMSFCSLASSSLMETLVFQPLGLSRAGCALLSACLAQPSAKCSGNPISPVFYPLQPSLSEVMNLLLPLAGARSPLCICCLGLAVLQRIPGPKCLVSRRYHHLARDTETI